VKAARIHEFGGTLRIDDTPEPSPGDGEVVVDVRFAGVNPLDVWVTQGTVAGGSQRLPFVPGVEAVGDLDGRPVLVHGGGLGTSRDGLYRERAAVPVAAIRDVPENVDPRQAAGIAVTGPTAWRLVHDVTHVGPEDRVLVLGASGGVGSLAVQLVKAAGATVCGQSSTEQKAEFVREIGADRVVVASAPELEDQVAGFEPTVVLDPLADGFTTAAVRAIQPFGRIALFGASAGSTVEFDLRALYRKSVQLLTYSGTIEPEERLGEAIGHVLHALAAGDLRAAVEVLPLGDAAVAHARIMERRVRGKLVLAP
jgi:NADPH2:quinone reductase